MTKLNPTWTYRGYTLRRGRAAEADAYYQQNFTHPDAEGDRFTGTGTFTRQQVVDFYLGTLADPDRYDFLLVAPDGRLVGESVLNDIDWQLKSANYRIMIFDPATRNLGLGSWLVTTARDFAFEQLGLHRLGLDVFSFNPRAQHVYAAAGYLVEGRSRDAVWDPETKQYGDDILMGMLATDPRPAWIRPAEADDLAAIMANETAGFTPAEAASPASMAARIAAYPETCLVAVMNGQVVGHVVGPAITGRYLSDDLFEAAEPNDPTAPFQAVLSLAVAPNAQGQGIGQQLMRRLAAVAHRAQRQGITLTCLPQLVSFYEQLGFVDEGVAASTHAGEVWHNMVKIL